MNAIGRIQADTLTIRLACIVDHLINIRWTEILARAAEFFDAACIANVCVVNYQMRWLILFMLGPRVIKIGELIERELAIAFDRAQQMSFSSAIGRQIRKLTHLFVSRLRRIAITHSTPACNHL